MIHLLELFNNVIYVKVAAISELGNMTLKSSLIFLFEVYEWWSNIIFSVHVTSALSAGFDPQRARMLPGCVGSVLLAAEVTVEVSIEFAVQNWDMGACLRVAAEHAKCLALLMCSSKAICPIVQSLSFFMAQAALSLPLIPWYSLNPVMF